MKRIGELIIFKKLAVFLLILVASNLDTACKTESEGKFFPDNPLIPKAPDNLEATAFSSTQIDLTWIDNSDNEDGFRIERADDNAGNPGAFENIDTVGIDEQSYRDDNNGSGLVPETTYHYRVKAYNEDGESLYSNYTNATTERYVLHGLGQYVPSFYTDEENWQYVTDYQNAVGEIPIIYSAYQGIDPDADDLDSTNLLDIVQNHGYPYILVVGLSLLDVDPLDPLNPVPNPSAILNGEWDDTIIDIANRIKSVNAPVFVRPGFEFGASSGYHEGFSGVDFIAIWNYIRNLFNNKDVINVTWVWNTVNPWQFNYMDYYPGNDAVDWWGINYFTKNQMDNSDGFVEDAALNEKPVMICESCPILNNGTENSENWDNWFVPYFNKIKEYYHIKAFIYISDPWDKPGFFDSWSYSCIDSSVTNETIRVNYITEMQDPCYIHMDEYLQYPSILESIGN